MDVTRNGVSEPSLPEKGLKLERRLRDTRLAQRQIHNYCKPRKRRIYLLERRNHAQTASVLVVARWNGGQPARCDAGLEKEKLAEFRRREVFEEPKSHFPGGK